MAKLASNGTPGFVEAATLDENPHKLTKDSGAADPPFSLSVYGEFGLVWDAGVRRAR